MLDVGQGDSQVLEFADGRVLVVDTGPAGPGFDTASRVLAPFLRARGWRRVDQVVITHEDGDHAGGLPGLLAELPVDELASGQETLAELADRGLLEGWKGRTAVLASGDTLARGPGYTVRVLWPPPGETALSSNQRSVVLEVEVGAERFILPADVDSTTERHWVGMVRSPVAALKLGHHGAGSSTGAYLLHALAPRLALVSCGRGNRFGHPHPATLGRLEGAGVPVRRTDREGSVHLVSGRPRFSPQCAAPRLTHRP
jgi:competence protein ComEC